MKRGCPCNEETPDPCQRCGATVKGDDPVNGICQADKLDAVVVTDDMVERAAQAMKRVYDGHIIGTVTASGNTPVSVYRQDGDEETRVFGPTHYDACAEWLRKAAAREAIGAALAGAD